MFRVFNIFFDMRGMVMVFNATFNIISVISWRSVPGKNHWPAASHWQTLSHIVTSSTPHHERDSNAQQFLEIFIVLLF